MKVGLDEMYKGSTRKLQMTRSVKCEKCSGSGSKSGKRYTCEVRAGLRCATSGCHRRAARIQGLAGLPGGSTGQALWPARYWRVRHQLRMGGKALVLSPPCAPATLLVWA